MLIAFDDMKRPVALNGCDEMAGAIESILHGWSFHKVKASQVPAPAITITKTSQGYSRQSQWLAKPAIYPNIINAACDFLVDAFKCYIAEDPTLLCLHTAAVDFGDGLYLLPSTYNAGKSTLSAHLAALGLKVFADDILYITQHNLGMAPGILPRLRQPLPDDGGKSFDDFIAQRRGPHSSRFLYLKPHPGELASYREKAPIKGIIELHRDPQAPLEMLPATTADILKRTLMQNLSEQVAALETLDRLHGICQAGRRFTLRYPDGASAARYLIEQLSCR